MPFLPPNQQHQSTEGTSCKLNKLQNAKLLQAVKITSGTLAFFCLVSQGQARSLDISTSGSATENNSTEV